jgi:hypothetical protein
MVLYKLLFITLLFDILTTDIRTMNTLQLVNKALTISAISKFMFVILLLTMQPLKLGL